MKASLFQSQRNNWITDGGVHRRDEHQLLLSARLIFTLFYDLLPDAISDPSGAALASKHVQKNYESNEETPRRCGEDQRREDGLTLTDRCYV